MTTKWKNLPIFAFSSLFFLFFPIFFLIFSQLFMIFSQFFGKFFFAKGHSAPLALVHWLRHCIFHIHCHSIAMYFLSVKPVPFYTSTIIFHVICAYRDAEGEPLKIRKFCRNRYKFHPFFRYFEYNYFNCTNSFCSLIGKQDFVNFF